MTSVHDDLVAEDIKPKLLKSKDDCQQLFGSSVMELGISQCLAHITNDNRLLVDMLSQNRSYCIVQSITDDLKR